MKLFKQKKTRRDSTAFENIQATVSQKQIASTATRREIEYEIEIDANMSQLVNGEINGIDIVTMPTDAIRETAPTLQYFNDNIKKYKKAKTIETTALTIDPKEFLPHGDLGDLSSPMISKLNKNGAVLRDDVIETKLKFVEKPILSTRIAGVSVNDIIDNGINFDRGQEPLLRTQSLHESIISPHGNLGLSRPQIGERTENIVPKITKKTITVRAPIGQIPEVRLVNSTGRQVGPVANHAKMVKTKTGQQAKIENFEYWSLLAKKGKMFRIEFSRTNNEDYMHVTTPYKAVISGFHIYARTLSRSPELDVIFDMGRYTLGRAKAICFAGAPFDLSKKMMFHVVPLINGSEISHSHTKVNPGEYDEYDVSCCAIQYLPNVIRFHISNMPVDVKQIFAIRTNDLSGQQLRLPLVSVNSLGGVKKRTTDKSNDAITDYDDINVADINSIYSYDFFAINRFGLEKHLFRKTIRTYEKDIEGHVFKKAKLFAGPSPEVERLSLTLGYPNPFIPKNINYSLTNPGDDFYEACRNNKRVCTLKIVKHVSDGSVYNLGTYIVNPGELNTLESTVDKFQNFEVSFDLDAAFLRNAGAPRDYNQNLKYYYEVRMGSYLLSNELSFRHNPLKLDVPNEFTDGKTGYSYHPYIYQCPSRKDYGLHGRLGTSKNYLFEESLNSSAKILVKEPYKNPYGSDTKPKLRAKLTQLPNGRYCIVLQLKLRGDLIEAADHFELYVGDSTTGDFRSIGKNKLANSNFYYIDAASADLAANKLKYKMTARNFGFEDIVTFESNIVNISQTNVAKRKDERTNVGNIGIVRLNALRGVK